MDENVESKKYRLNVNFAESTYKTLEELARKQGKNKAEVIRDVIALAKYIQDTRDEGGHILVQRKGGKMQELVLL